MDIQVTVDVEPNATADGEPALRSHAVEDTLPAAIERVAHLCAHFHEQGYQTSYRIAGAGQEWRGTVPWPDGPGSEAAQLAADAEAWLTQKLDRFASDMEAQRAGTAGMVAYTRQLEGLLRRVADAWNSDGDEAGDNLVAIGEVVDAWERIDPERQG